MFVLPGINIKTSGVSLISDTISDFTSKDQTTALHVIVHNVFKNRCKLLVVHEIEENLFIGCDIDSNVTFDEV